jgi:squalene synthase HpnC
VVLKTLTEQAADQLTDEVCLGLMPPERVKRENFTVALRTLPPERRDALRAVYRYARFVDDVGDEAVPEHRTRLLDVVEHDIDRLYAGETPSLPAVQAMAGPVRGHGIPDAPLRKLVQANRQDQQVARYETWDDLVQYCTLSADPVGHLVLYVFDAASPERMVLSDRVCTALQVVEHLQDVAEDARAGRVYLPAEDLRAFGCADADLSAATTPTRLRGALARVADRAEHLLDDGAPLVGDLHSWARVCVAGYLAGGRATLAALRAAAYDVHAAPPVRPRRRRIAAETARAALGRS